jgi:hypothetical protein
MYKSKQKYKDGDKMSYRHGSKVKSMGMGGYMTEAQKDRAQGLGIEVTGSGKGTGSGKFPNFTCGGK